MNLSAPDILDPDLGNGILRLLLLEITESAVMRDPELAARHMQPLRAAGLQFAIDDFGAGPPPDWVYFRGPTPGLAAAPIASSIAPAMPTALPSPDALI